MTTNILVVGQTSSASTGVLRALWSGGDVCDLLWRGSHWEKIFRSRAARSFIRVSSRSAPGLPDFGAALLERAKHGDYDLVIPISDWQTWLVATHTAELEPHVSHLTPDPAAFELANDKAATMAHARRIGIPTPQVWDWPDAPDLDSLPPDVQFPVVIKARLGSGVSRGVRFATDRQQLRQRYLEIESFPAREPTEDFTKPMIMEFIPGFVHDACAVAKQGEVINLLTQVRQLMAPITGGVGAVNITTDEPELGTLARALLESLNWTGPAQVEFKYDPRDGQYKLIELNPRLWGTLDLSIRAGMNFPAQIRDLALDRAVARGQSYQVGLRYRFISRAWPAYIQLARAHGMDALLDRRRYAATSMGLDLRDPNPGIYEVATTTATLARGLGGFLGRAARRRAPGDTSAGVSGLPPIPVNTLDRSGDPGY